MSVSSTKRSPREVKLSTGIRHDLIQWMLDWSTVGKLATDAQTQKMASDNENLLKNILKDNSLEPIVALKLYSLAIKNLKNTPYDEKTMTPPSWSTVSFTSENYNAVNTSIVAEASRILNFLNKNFNLIMH